MFSSISLRARRVVSRASRSFEEEDKRVAQFLPVDEIEDEGAEKSTNSLIAGVRTDKIVVTRLVDWGSTFMVLVPVPRADGVQSFLQFLQ